MLGRKKRAPDEEFDDEEYEEVDDIDSADEDALGDADLQAITNGDDEEKGLKKKYTNLMRMFNKHLIYVRTVTLLSLTAVVGISLAGGILSGLHTQGAKAREITASGTTVQFSKTGASLTVGQAYRSGNNILVPLYNDGTTPINTSQKADASNGTFSGMSTSLTLPTYGSGSSDTSAGFIPISAKNYRMYVTALKGKLSPSTQVRYVKFGATGIGAVVLSNVQSDTTVRVLLENKKVYKVPGAASPGLTVNGTPVDTKRDVLLINTNLGTTKLAQRKFTISSSASDLLRVAYADDYMKVWNNDKLVLDKLMRVDKQKLLELESNKTSLDASADATSGSESASTEQVSNGETAIAAQKTIVESDKASQQTLADEKTALEKYITTVSSQMTMSTDYQLK